jgi:hypothetical protein
MLNALHAMAGVPTATAELRRTLTILQRLKERD